MRLESRLAGPLAGKVRVAISVTLLADRPTRCRVGLPYHQDGAIRLARNPYEYGFPKAAFATDNQLTVVLPAPGRDGTGGRVIVDGGETAAGLAGSSVIVTGAAGEIGAAYVRAFARAGANVTAMDLPTTMDGAGGRLQRVGDRDSGRVVLVAGDVTSDSDWETVVRRSLAEFGGVDALVNNAAVYRALARKRPLTELTVDDWDRVLAVNVRGTWQGIRAAAPALVASGRGRVVNISSVVGRTGAAGFAHYVASKAAVEGLTRAAARELGPDRVCVNAVAPGLVDNESTRELNTADYLAGSVRGRCLARPMAASDLVGAVLWLSSPAAGFVTGQTIVVDGGQVFV